MFCSVNTPATTALRPDERGCRAGAATYDLFDGQGSVRAQTNGSGTVTGSAAYDPWGNARGTVSTTTKLGWTGESRDSTTGLTYLRARDYDPLVGHFTARDTVSPNAPGSQGWNAYAYAANSPVTLVDPTGHAANPTTMSDIGETVDLLTKATTGHAETFKLLPQMNPAAAVFVTALLIFRLMMPRTVIVQVLMSLGVGAS